MAGYQKKNAILTNKEKLIVSYHEIGHALVAAKQTDSAPVQNYLEGKVFAGNAGTSEEPDAKDIEGFEKFIENYKGAIAVEKTASEVIK